MPRLTLFPRVAAALMAGSLGLWLTATDSWIGRALPVSATLEAQGAPVGVPAIVFASRAIPAEGTVYWNVPKGMPGVMAYSRFENASPGRLIVREANGTLRVLVDGAAPGAASLNLIDVSAPDVSFDGTSIVFAGLPQGNHARGPLGSPGAWRIYTIDVAGTNLRQVTVSDLGGRNMSQFGGVAGVLSSYDDIDPAWLPDGRIVFASSRYPGFAQYGGTRSTNLFVVNRDGTNMHRITAEKNGAERPMVDPLTGRIVYSRWWRNFRLASNDMSTVTDPAGYKRHIGLVSALDADALGGVPGGSLNINRNAWQLTTINPDGTNLRQFAGQSTLFFEPEDNNHAYGGSFAQDGSLFTTFFPMMNGSEASGFGGIRRYDRGPHGFSQIIGIRTNVGSTRVSNSPPSYGVYVGNYAADPEVLPDGRLVISWAPDINQDYGLHVVNADGSGRQLLWDGGGTTELRARVIRARPTPPIIPDSVTQVASLLPPVQSGPYNIDGNFTFDALNVFFNAPVDAPIVSAVGVGQAASIRFYTDPQRIQTGSNERMDWPILLAEMAVNPDGSVNPTQAPANIPLFEQLRSAQPAYTVPLTGRGTLRGGAAHVAGMNFGRSGAVERCVGCHAGHTMIPVPATREEARWTNLAPGATVRWSSLEPSLNATAAADGLVDRRAHTGTTVQYWRSDPAQAANQQWVELEFPVPVKVRTVRLWDPRTESDVTTQINSARVRLYDQGTTAVGDATASALSENGSDVAFADVRARRVRVDFLSVSGLFYGKLHASLAEIEVIANADAAATTDADGDLMPDAWELQYGLNAALSDGGADADGDGVSNYDEYVRGTHPKGTSARYFAEGATGTFFSTEIDLLNTGSTSANVLLRYLKEDGGTVSKFKLVPAHTRATERVQETQGLASTAFSTIVESDTPVVTSRTMTWTNRSYGSHAEGGVSAPATSWYLAEGATHSGFSLFYLLQNPSTSAAQVTVEFLRPAPNAPIVKQYVLAPLSRQTVWVNQVDSALAATDVSAVIRTTNSVAIVVERAMYLDRAGTPFNAGHGSAGVTTPATQWFLAEGATGPYFDMFILVANPSTTQAQVRATYLLPSGATQERNYVVAPRSRFNIWVDQEGAALADTAVSVTLTSTNAVPIIVERSMWWPGDASTWNESHNSPGATTTGVEWAVAQGEVGGPANRETYLLLANTGASAGTARVTLMLENGATLVRSFALPARSRVNVAVGAAFLPSGSTPGLAPGSRFGALVESLGAAPAPLVVECAMYSDADGVKWAAGTNSVATKLR